MELLISKDNYDRLSTNKLISSDLTAFNGTFVLYLASSDKEDASQDQWKTSKPPLTHVKESISDDKLSDTVRNLWTILSYSVPIGAFALCNTSSRCVCS